MLDSSSPVAGLSSYRSGSFSDYSLLVTHCNLTPLCCRSHLPSEAGGDTCRPPQVGEINPSATLGANSFPTPQKWPSLLLRAISPNSTGLSLGNSSHFVVYSLTTSHSQMVSISPSLFQSSFGHATAHS